MITLKLGGRVTEVEQNVRFKGSFLLWWIKASLSFPKITCTPVCFESVSVFLLPSVHAGKHKRGWERGECKRKQRINCDDILFSASMALLFLCIWAWVTIFPRRHFWMKWSWNIQIILSFGMANYDILCNNWSYDHMHPITIFKQIYITWVANFPRGNVMNVYVITLPVNILNTPTHTSLLLFLPQFRKKKEKIVKTMIQH